MINHFNSCLSNMFSKAIPNISVSFEPPTEGWWKAGANNGNALNVYLVDVRENRDLRSNEFVRRPPKDGSVEEISAPRRIDCHYLITAWSPALETAGVEPTLDEHALLYEVIRTLMQNEPLNLQRIVNAIVDDNEKQSWTKSYEEPLSEIQLPMQVLPADGFPKYGEFWSSMGQNSRWKPVVYLIVTLPVLAPPVEAGSQVTSHVLKYHFLDAKHMDSGHFGIAGRLVKVDQKNHDVSPASEVDVLLMEAGVERGRSRTDADGRFVFEQTAQSEYTISTQSNGQASIETSIKLPPPVEEPYRSPQVDQYELLIVQKP